ncbi:hypothetical protein [Octadecabacter ascidiaceicola]|uniref:Transposase n=1 Tax=Octadecabacter ascidiaceicola TaxID=1655543 RepID=A0A238KHU8_9RHOB|nr:hypothetical protein [Octadecabacter ascidiaceicola]SMX42405.1 hypothetical protein OCA8868_02730 [Octadecabacter ascidiaceicola]
MNAHTRNELSSDKKIGDVFYAFGYSIPVSKTGKKLWPALFKRAIVYKLMTNELTANQVATGCKIPLPMVYDWKSANAHHVLKQIEADQEPAFAEIQIQETPLSNDNTIGELRLKFEGIELTLPVDYPVDGIIKIIRTFRVKQ